eukprot:4209328-Amphidinium_carterae.2
MGLHGLCCTFVDFCWELFGVLGWPLEGGLASQCSFESSSAICVGGGSGCYKPRPLSELSNVPLRCGRNPHRAT